MTDVSTTRVHRAWLDFAVSGLAVVALSAFLPQWDRLTLEEWGWIGLVLCVFLVGRAWTREPYGPLSSTSLYLSLLCLFHVGLLIALALGADPTGHIDDATWYWLYEDATLSAARLSLSGIAACAFGMALSDWLGPSRIAAVPLSDRADAALGRLGAALTAGSIAAWFLVLVRAGGLGIFLGSYGAMLDVLEGTGVTALYLLLHIGVPLLAATRWRSGHSWGWGAFALFSVGALLVGVRGQVLFTLAGALPVFAAQGLRVRVPWVVLGLAATLGVSTAVRDIRVVGIANLQDVEELSGNPLNGVMELGSSIRPVVEVIRWYESGDDPIWGASYLATIDRPLSRVVPWMERIPASEDERMMNVLVEMKQVGAIGFSPIAEAYRNFGELGVIVIMGLTGLMLGRFDAAPRVGIYPALVGVVLIPQLIQVRNSFQHVPFSTAVPVVMVLVTVWLADRSGPMTYTSRSSPGTRRKPWTSPNEARNVTTATAGTDQAGPTSVRRPT